MAQRHQLAIDIPHRDIEIEPPLLDLLRRHAHSQPLDPFLRQCRLHLEVHDHRREPHAGAVLVLGLEVSTLGGVAGRLALAGRLQQLAQLGRGEELVQVILEGSGLAVKPLGMEISVLQLCRTRPCLHVLIKTNLVSGVHSPGKNPRDTPAPPARCAPRSTGAPTHPARRGSAVPRAGHKTSSSAAIARRRASPQAAWTPPTCCRRRPP